MCSSDLLSSPTTTVVSSVLTDPRLSAGVPRLGVRAPPPQTTLPPPQGAVLAPPKAKQQVKVKSRVLGESEKKSHSVEESVAKPAEESKKVENREEVHCYYVSYVVTHVNVCLLSVRTKALWERGYPKQKRSYKSQL